ncbi:YcgL domain-containing protein [Nitrosococcus watsonii]|uniref:YcgL domain-containing protein Nwat_2809 n=1 Tax=Nitrosococcus watsoni (strain C-113) TaxID=105559 RepID=D8KBC0_NITWC|nr:YcgL domain-containing protein [Nitrosococcus watsonii]ADJ29567.1 HAD-superfamily hydrolase, subfamily IIB [Nitrosococcus watsonii C-113]
MKQEILLCSDLDRTLLPNGQQGESPQARLRLRRLTQRPEITLTYVSGRHKALIQSAIGEYDLPLPDFAIGDVGTTIYQITDNQWHPWEDWSKEIGQDWREINQTELAKIFADITPLRLQEPEKQNRYKLSYYASPDLDWKNLISQLEQRLQAQKIQASFIWSVDETARIGLLDILPKRANKLHAIRFLMERRHFDKRHTVFAGDSGNDLEVLTSGLQAILVRNAQEEVRQEALRRLPPEHRQQLYLARGGFMGLNGYYSAGVLEGLAHFFPETRVWMEIGREQAAGEETAQACAIYRSRKKNDSYLYVEAQDNFSRVPAKLLEMLGELEFVMRLELHSEISLAQANTREVMQMLREKGYFLQLPSREYRRS